MRRSVRVYIEGGAKGKTSDSDFRRGWKTFLNELHNVARDNGYDKLVVVRGGGRRKAFDSFTRYKDTYPNDLCVLLVDAEMAVPDGSPVWGIVARRDGDHWQRPVWATERHLYFMVPFVEAWLLTDQDALQKFFKQGFKPKVLPTTDLENRSKHEIDQALKKATLGSPKGPYLHGQAHEIIEIVKPERVKTLRHGQRLFTSLGNLIKNEPDP